MAALSALRNRNSQKMREGFESFLAKCVESSENKSEVDLSFVVKTMEDNNIKLEQKELSRLEKICDNNNKINRYSKKSVTKYYTYFKRYILSEKTLFNLQSRVKL